MDGYDNHCEVCGAGIVLDDPEYDESLCDDCVTKTQEIGRIISNYVRPEVLIARREHEIDSLKDLLRDALEGLDEYWMTSPEGVLIVERIRAKLGIVEG